MNKFAYLGLSYGYHDSAVTAVDENGEILYAEHEERLSRIKHDNRFPYYALHNCISFLFKNGFLIKHIGYYEDPQLKELRQILDIFKYNPLTPEISAPELQAQKFYELSELITTNVSCNSYNLTDEIKNVICNVYSHACCPLIKSTSFSHHHTHAAGAFYSSPFDTSIIISMDGAGEFETVTIWKGDKATNTLEKVNSTSLPFSLGLFYSAITNYLGFRVNEGEYKVMGLSAYGSPDYVDLFSSLIDFDEGTAYINQNCFDFGPSSDKLFTHALIDLLPLPPATNTDWVKHITDTDGPVSHESHVYCSIAKSAQQVLTNLQLKFVEYSVKSTSVTNLCVVGGVALNTLANMELDKMLEGKFYVFPPSGDAGSSIGAAYLALINDKPSISFISKTFNPFLGLAHSDKEYKEMIYRSDLISSGGFKTVELSKLERIEWTAKNLLEKKIVAVHQSRAEFGPRALGNRSILASGFYSEMKEKLNLFVKKRESYRPYAPAIAEDLLEEHFKVKTYANINKSHPLYYMASVIKVPETLRTIYPSAVHYDCTVRIQLLSKELTPYMYELSHKLFELCQCGIILNTSFNLGYEALVGTLDDAITTISWSDFNCALFGNIGLSR